MPEDHSCVCVVDDDRSMRESLRDLLCSTGLNVLTFASAHEFLTHRRPDVPTCLVLDVRLPGLSGLELQQELAKVHASMPIIFITGHGDIPMTVRAMKAGAVEFLTKPVKPRDLLAAIRGAIERGRVSHVALWAGAGRIVHSALSRGGVGVDDLFGSEPRMMNLRANLVGVRRCV